MQKGKLRFLPPGPHQSCPTLCDPVDCSPPGSSVHAILQARILEWVAISFSRRELQQSQGLQYLQGHRCPCPRDARPQPARRNYTAEASRIRAVAASTLTFLTIPRGHTPKSPPEAGSEKSPWQTPRGMETHHVQNKPVHDPRACPASCASARFATSQPREIRPETGNDTAAASASNSSLHPAGRRPLPSLL